MFLFLSKLFLKLMGWKIGGLYPVPEEFRQKCVLIAAPHTSNWDMPLTIAIAKVLDIKIGFTVSKDAIFFPLNILTEFLGAIPVDRSKRGIHRKSTTQMMVDLLIERQRLALVIPPEATQKKTDEWHTGFYHIARGANVPILVGFMDYKEKKGGILGVVHPTGNIAKDMSEIMQYYKNVTGKYPEKFALDKRYS